MESPGYDRSKSTEPLSYAPALPPPPTMLPTSIGITMIACGTVVMVGPVIVSAVGDRLIGGHSDTETIVLFFGGLVGALMVIFGAVKSLRRE